MKINLQREIKTPEFTLGKMYLDDVFKFFTVEDKVREKPGVPVSEWKIPGLTAIPAGDYRVIINWSNRFKKHLPLLLDVPGFMGVRIHAGNTSEDTEGCILIGTKRTKTGVANSRFAMDVLDAELRDAQKRGEIITMKVG